MVCLIQKFTENDFLILITYNCYTKTNEAHKSLSTRLPN